MRRAAIALLVALLVLPGPATAFAATCPRTSLADLEDEVMCQVCGVPLGMANDTLQAKRERAFIKRLVAQCNTKDAIKTELVAQFGPSVLAEPPHHGFDATAYLVPAIMVTFGAAGIASIGLAWRRRGAQGSAASRSTTPVLDPADRERVDAALERWEP